MTKPRNEYSVPLSLQRAVLLLLLITTVLSGCGFHLRGVSKLQSSFSTLALKGREGQAFRQVLVDKLEKSGVTLDDNAPYTIRLLGEQSQKRVSAYSTRAKSAGFELKRIITFKIVAPGQKEEQFSEVEIFSRRHLLFREDQIIGKLGEEGMLWQEMDQELADRIIRRLEAIDTGQAVDDKDQELPTKELSTEELPNTELPNTDNVQ